MTVFRNLCKKYRIPPKAVTPKNKNKKPTVKRSTAVLQYRPRLSPPKKVYPPLTLKKMPLPPQKKQQRRSGSSDHARSCARRPGPHLRSQRILRGDHLPGRYGSFGGPVRHVLQGRSIQGAFPRAHWRGLSIEQGGRGRSTYIPGLCLSGRVAAKLLGLDYVSLVTTLICAHTVVYHR